MWKEGEATDARGARIAHSIAQVPG